MPENSVSFLDFSRNPVKNRKTSTDLLLDILLPHKYLDSPISKENNLKTALSRIYTTLVIAEDALNSFLDAEYKSFDALLGNNSCCITSYLIFYLSSNKKSLKITEEITQLAKLKAEIYKSLIAPTAESKTLRNFLRSTNISLISYESIILTIAFACAHSKKMNLNQVEQIDYSQLLAKYQPMLPFNLTKNSITILVKHWQKWLSFINIKVLQDHATEVTGLEALWTKYLKDKYIVKDHRGRKCSPSLFSVRTIFNLLSLLPGSYLGLQVNLIQKPKKFLTRFTLFFQVYEDKIAYIEESEIKELNTAVFLFSGCKYIETDRPQIDLIKQQFIRRGIRDTVIAHEVNYPQYPKSTNQEDLNPCEFYILKELKYYNELAGYSIHDPSEFCTTHIYIDTIQNQQLAYLEPPIFLPNHLDFI